MTSKDTTALVERLAMAAQDAVTVFGEETDSTVNVNGRLVPCKQTHVLHSPGPAALRERVAARVAVQDEANRLMRAGALEEARWLLLDAARVEHARYAQYAGHWDGHVLGRAVRTIRPKSGDVLKWDALLVTQDDAEWDAGDGGERPWTVYSARIGVDLAVPQRAVRKVAT
jgi:hypothetical protein